MDQDSQYSALSELPSIQEMLDNALLPEGEQLRIVAAARKTLESMDSTSHGRYLLHYLSNDGVEFMGKVIIAQMVADSPQGDDWQQEIDRIENFFFNNLLMPCKLDLDPSAVRSLKLTPSIRSCRKRWKDLLKSHAHGGSVSGGRYRY